jgi:hypothetical protein
MCANFVTGLFFVQRVGWSGSNPRPAACKVSGLQLSYAPCEQARFLKQPFRHSRHLRYRAGQKRDCWNPA